MRQVRRPTAAALWTTLWQADDPFNRCLRARFCLWLGDRPDSDGASRQIFDMFASAATCGMIDPLANRT